MGRDNLMKVGAFMGETGNLMNSKWFGEKTTLAQSEIKEKILKSVTEKEVLFNLIELFKTGDFTQKPLLVQLMNQTKDEAILNLCIRVFFSVATHEDLRDSNNLRFLSEVTEETVATFASAATTSLSFEIIPYLLALLEEWEEVSDTATIIETLLILLLILKSKLVKMQLLMKLEVFILYIVRKRIQIDIIFNRI